MNLIIDNGNTSVKLAWFSHGQPVEHESFTAENEEGINHFFSMHPVAAAILSTVNNLPQAVTQFLRNHEVLYLNASVKVPLINRYQTPETLGNDRLANAVGASTRFPGEKALVIDAGTCLKFDFVDESNTYLGGSISPGLHVRYLSLNEHTDKLPLLDAIDKAPLCGIDTKSSIHSGVLNGMQAEVEGMIEKYKEEHGHFRIILTGGDYRYFLNSSKTSIFADPALTLRGLDAILRYNQ